MGMPGMEGGPPPASHVPGVDVQPGEVVFAQGMDPGMMGMMGGGTWPEGTVMTNYYYRAGRRHNQTPLAPLCSDQTPVHNGLANVLFSDGAVKSISEGPWRELGFETPEEIQAERTGEPVPEGSYW